MLDVNAGIPLADEPAILAQTVRLVQSLTDLPLSIDSSIVEALEAGLAAYQGKALVNSVTGEEERLERVLPLVRRYGAAVVAISNDETGISEDPDVRFAVARRIVERAADHGIPREDVIVDPLVMPIGAMPTAGRQVFRLLRPPARRAEGQHDLRRLATSASACPTARASTAPSSRWPSRAASRPPSRTRSRRGSGDAVMAADVLMGNDAECGALDPGHPRAARRRARKAGDRTGGGAPAVQATA